MDKIYNFISKKLKLKMYKKNNSYDLQENSDSEKSNTRENEESNSNSKNNNDSNLQKVKKVILAQMKKQLCILIKDF